MSIYDKKIRVTIFSKNIYMIHTDIEERMEYEKDLKNEFRQLLPDEAKANFEDLIVSVVYE